MLNRSISYMWNGGGVVAPARTLHALLSPAVVQRAGLVGWSRAAVGTCHPTFMTSTAGRGIMTRVEPIGKVWQHQVCARVGMLRGMATRADQAFLKERQKRSGTYVSCSCLHRAPTSPHSILLLLLLLLLQHALHDGLRLPVRSVTSCCGGVAL
jgi:hypothetical protein